ncbi:MAG: response regulator [Desulfuromonadales bacterium]
MNGCKSKILIVDDEPVNIKLLEGILKHDYELHSSLNGFDAIERVKELMPDLILLDIMMPDVNGFDVCRIIRSNKLFNTIQIIFLTALNSLDTEMECLELGCIDFITKPFDHNLLKLRIRNHLELKRQSDLIRKQKDEITFQKEQLEASISRVKHLEGIIPICMYCKKIRDVEKSWVQLERYITEHSEANFSHGICPECFAEQMATIKGR